MLYPTHDYNHSLYYEGDDTSPKYWTGYDCVAGKCAEGQTPGGD